VYSYKEATKQKKKEAIRNDLFMVLLPYLSKWCVACLKRRNIYFNKQELLSYVWEAYLFCLDKYVKLEVPLPSHFTKYIFYFTFIYQKEKNNMENLNLDLYKCGYDSGMETETYIPTIFSSADIIIRFRNSLDEIHQAIFDDALFGTSAENYPNSFKKSGKSRLPFYKYNAAKDVYKKIIAFFLDVYEDYNVKKES
jgi:hypothetical protein